MASAFGLLTPDDPRAPRVTGVTVDGREVLVNKVMACDDKRGWAVLIKRDAEGRAQLNAAKTGLEMELLIGDVDVTIADAAEGDH